MFIIFSSDTSKGQIAFQNFVAETGNISRTADINTEKCNTLPRLEGHAFSL